jgi:hypothetical protein
MDGVLVPALIGARKERGLSFTATGPDTPPGGKHERK